MSRLAVLLLVVAANAADATAARVHGPTHDLDFGADGELESCPLACGWVERVALDKV